jgi:2-keto-4-pentenoate hydratase/2-oxohepta-3-ene-1,7-dioic acid hydratase in catechol pathway
MLALIDAGVAGLAAARKRLSEGHRATGINDVRLLAPLPEPRQIRDFMCSQHVRDGFRGMTRLRARILGDPEPTTFAEPSDIYGKQPIYYITNRFNVIGPDADIVWPGYTEYLDYELEVGVVIGRNGRNIPVAQAGDYILGYTIFNDVSARDRQMREMQGMLGPTKGKSFDTGNVVGPWIVTKDEIPDVNNLDVAVRVNGEIRGKNTTAGWFHSFETMISFVSEDEGLRAGELFASGTIGGCCGLEISRFLQDGDLIELDVSRIGTLRNRVRRIAS